MRLKGAATPKQLLEFGFKKITLDYKANHPAMEFQEGYAYNLGHSRRGQFYYLICSDEGFFSVFASEPDGSGGKKELPIDSIFSRLYASGLVS